MKKARIIGIFSCALALGLVLFAPSAQSDTWNKKTVITITQPMQIPGMTLAPGKYVFKLADSSSNRHIVHVFTEDEKQVLATILAIPNYRLKPTGDSEFGLWETPKGTPSALRSWFYPGDNFGQEFSYPKPEATVLSSVVQQEVPFITAEQQTELSRTPMPDETIQDRRTAEVQTEEKVEQAQVTPEPTPQPEPEAPKAETPAAVEPAPEVSEPAPAPAQNEELPRTASYLPLIGLSGVLFLGSGLVVRVIRKGNS